MRLIDRFMPYFHGVGLGLLFRLSVAYGSSAYAYNVLFNQYWWIPDLFILMTLAAGAAVSMYFGFRKEEEGFWRKLLITAGIAVTIAMVSLVGRAAILGLPVIPYVTTGLEAGKGLLYGGAFFVLSSLSQGIVLLHFMTEKKIAD